jgi:hypothetical protein
LREASIPSTRQVARSSREIRNCNAVAVSIEMDGIRQ